MGIALARSTGPLGASMKPAMYIFMRKDLRMSTGKAAAQAAQAAACALRLRPDANLTNQWFRGGHHMVLVMECRDRDHLVDSERYVNDRGFATAMQVDEGHTEVDPITPTCFATEIVDKDWPHASETFGTFRLYKPDYTIIDTSRLTHAEYQQIKHWINEGWTTERINEWLRKRHPQRPTLRERFALSRRS